MNIVRTAARCPMSGLGTQIVVCLLSSALMLAIWPKILFAEQDEQAPQTPPHAQQTPEQLQQLVAPIALYSDSLVAQILAASTFPEQVVEADRWLQAHPDLKGDALGQAVDPQPWDPSVKALTALPSVLGNMDKNLSWTSSLGDAFYNQQQDVMDAVQVMRQRAQAAGNLRSTPQQAVEDQDSSIVIQPPAPMWCTFPRMIRGWCTVIRWWRGQVGTRTQESGMAARTLPSESASTSVSWGLLAGVGVSGDLIGVTDTQSITMAGITLGATRFTTGTAITGAEASAA
jgi:hypothetical protein